MAKEAHHLRKIFCKHCTTGYEMKEGDFVNAMGEAFIMMGQEARENLFLLFHNQYSSAIDCREFLW